MRVTVGAMGRALAPALLAFVALAGCGERPRHATLPAGTTVLALGDSLTYGTGAGLQASYPVRLAERSGWNVVNAGVPGNTASQGCERLPDLIEEHRPRLALVMLGGNDFLRRRPESDVVQALETCVAAARLNDLSIVLMPVPRFALSGLANAPLYEDLARRLGVPLVDPGLAKLLGDASKRADPIHLNADGYRALADALAEELRKLGYLAR